MSNRKYFRRDIEGLRALAVVLVVLYHFQVPGFGGGFIGVDVFFVISGFVITQLLNRKMGDGSFRYRDFYARRIRRLVPVFLLVSTVTFILISPFYVTDDYYIAAKSWMFSLIGMSNIYYFSELSQYFSPAAHTLPYLQTWSLAVEEQFYFIWPTVLLLAGYFYKGRHGGSWFMLLLAASLGVSAYMANVYPTAAYYLLPARIFEFLLGTGVAVHGNKLPPLGRKSAELLAVIGIILIVSSGTLLSSADTFPGFNAFWPTLGTALVIYVGIQHPNTLVGRVLSIKPMVFMGAISYSLYLWHWSPVALMHYQLVDLSWYATVGLLALVVALSAFSYYFVENRYRYLPWSFKKSFLILVFLPLLITWAVESSIRLVPDLSFRFLDDGRRELFQIISQRNSSDIYSDCFKGDPVNFDKSAACIVGAPPVNGQPNAMLLGDSHALAQSGFLEQLLKGTNLSVLMVTQASTAFVAGQWVNEIYFANPQGEKVLRDKSLTRYLAKQPPMTIFLGAEWAGYMGSKHRRGYFIKTIGWLLAQGHHVIILEDVPLLPSAAWAHCLLVNRDDCSIDAAPVYKRLHGFQVFKQRVQSQYPQVQWINPRKVMCDATRCQTVLNGIPLYRDESHLNYVGASEIGREFLQQYGNPLLPEYAASTKSGAVEAPQ